MKRPYLTIIFCALAALLLAAGCGSDDDEDEAPAVEYKVLGGRLVWCSGGAEDMTVPATASSIGNNAFGECGSIRTLAIPKSVTHIMSGAFSRVTIETIYFGGTRGEWAAMAEKDGFGETLRGTPVICSDGEWRWTAPAVPDSPWQIENGVLVRYTGDAENVTIPDEVTAIGDGAFEGCAGITHVTIPGSVTEIGNNAFKDCTGLAGVTIPGGVTAIGESAFEGCAGITHVTIPGSVTEIGADAFKGCTSLAGVAIPGGVTVIGENAFSGCASLTRLDIPASVETVGAGAIPAGTAVTYHGTAERWDELAEDGALDGVTAFIVDESGILVGYSGNTADVTEVTIPDGVTGIASGVFAGHSEIGHVVIPAGVTGIAPDAFDWSKITEIEYKGDTETWDALVEASGIAGKVADITVTCADGTWTHTHIWGEEFENDGADGHHRVCTVCNAQSKTVPHTYGGETCTDDGHAKTCAECKHTETAPHSWSEYSDDKDGSHSRTCAVEGFKTHSEQLLHTWGDHETDGTDGHHRVCTVCNAQSKTVPHTYGGETCTDDGHAKTCADCKHTESKSHSWSEYADDKDGSHSRTCAVEGFKTHTERTAHGYGAYTDNKNGKHSRTCSVCSATETETHGYEYKDNADGSHYKTCTAKCGYSEDVAHDWSDYADDKDGNHSRTCEIEGFKAHTETKKHYYVDDICTDCGAEDAQATSVYVRGNNAPWYASNVPSATASDTNSGIRLKPFATIQKAVDAVIERNDGTSEYTIFVDGTLTRGDDSYTGANGMADFSASSKNLTVKIKALSDTATLDANQKSRVIYACPASGTLDLTLENLTITGGTVSISTSGGGGVYVDNNAKLTMKGGEISGNTVNYGRYGGGVWIKSGTFTMESGTIENNTAQYGGGVQTSGTFIMSGGTISDNNATNGGGVNNSGTFTMNGGVISGNTAYTFGGGVYSSGTFEMKDGTISGNAVTYSSGGYGGGVATSGTFIMSGGVISGNTVTSWGGGVYKQSGSTFTNSGGTVSGNTPDNVY